MTRLLAAAAAVALMTTAAMAGSITITYTNDAGTVLYSPTASISNADANKFVAWCEAHYAGTPNAATAQGCFNTWADDWFNQTKASINESLLAAAQAAATASSIALNPAQ